MKIQPYINPNLFSNKYTNLFIFKKSTIILKHKVNWIDLGELFKIDQPYVWHILDSLLEQELLLSQKEDVYDVIEYFIQKNK